MVVFIRYVKKSVRPQCGEKLEWSNYLGENLNVLPREKTGFSFVLERLIWECIQIEDGRVKNTQFCFLIVKDNLVRSWEGLLITSRDLWYSGVNKPPLPQPSLNCWEGEGEPTGTGTLRYVGVIPDKYVHAIF